VFAIIALVAESGGGCQEEAACDNGSEEGETEEEEGVFAEGAAVAGC